MMPQLNICRMSRYTIGDHSNQTHSITKSIVGPWPLAPHQDYLQYMQAGLKPGYYMYVCDMIMVYETNSNLKHS